MFTKLFKSNSRYSVGQIWDYQTRPGEEGSTFTIVNIEDHPDLGTIISIYVEGLHLTYQNDRMLTEISHMPFSIDAIEQSIISLKGKTNVLPEFNEGYESWKVQLSKGAAGIFTININKAIEYMEQAINQ
jgi:hypothetical protein